MEYGTASDLTFFERFLPQSYARRGLKLECKAFARDRVHVQNRCVTHLGWQMNRVLIVKTTEDEKNAIDQIYKNMTTYFTQKSDAAFRKLEEYGMAMYAARIQKKFRTLISFIFFEREKIEGRASDQGSPTHREKSTRRQSERFVEKGTRHQPSEDQKEKNQENQAEGQADAQAGKKTKLWPQPLGPYVKGTACSCEKKGTNQNTRKTRRQKRDPCMRTIRNSTNTCFLPMISDRNFIHNRFTRQNGI